MPLYISISSHVFINLKEPLMPLMSNKIMFMIFNPRLICVVLKLLNAIERDNALRHKSVHDKLTLTRCHTPLSFSCHHLTSLVVCYHILNYIYASTASVKKETLLLTAICIHVSWHAKYERIFFILTKSEWEKTEIWEN